MSDDFCTLYPTFSKKKYNGVYINSSGKIEMFPANERKGIPLRGLPKLPISIKVPRNEVAAKMSYLERYGYQAVYGDSDYVLFMRGLREEVNESQMYANVNMLKITANQLYGKL